MIEVKAYAVARGQRKDSCARSKILISINALLAILFAICLYHTCVRLNFFFANPESHFLGEVLHTSVFVIHLACYLFFSIGGFLLLLSAAPLFHFKGRPHFVKTYLSFSIWVFLAGISLLVTVSNMSDIRARLGPDLSSGMKSLLLEHPYYRSAETRDFSQVGDYFNFLQSKYECCGVDDSDDYKKADFPGRFNLTLPQSCCKRQTGKEMTKCQMRKPGSIYGKGCHVILAKRWDAVLQEEWQWLIGIGSSAVITGLIAFFSAICMLRDLKAKRSRSPTPPSIPHVPKEDPSQTELVSLQGASLV